jgi:hypothetical protein
MNFLGILHVMLTRFNFTMWWKFLAPLSVVVKQLMMHVCSYMTNVMMTYFLFEFVFMISVINTVL